MGGYCGEAFEIHPIGEGHIAKTPSEISGGVFITIYY